MVKTKIQRKRKKTPKELPKEGQEVPSTITPDLNETGSYEEEISLPEKDCTPELERLDLFFQKQIQQLQEEKEKYRILTSECESNYNELLEKFNNEKNMLNEDMQNLSIELTKERNKTQHLLTLKEEQDMSIADLKVLIETKNKTNATIETVIETLKLQLKAMAKASPQTKSVSSYKSKNIGKGIQGQLPESTIESMIQFAKELPIGKGNWYQIIANKFDVSSNTSYKYCKSIYQSKKKEMRKTR